MTLLLTYSITYLLFAKRIDGSDIDLVLNGQAMAIRSFFSPVAVVLAHTFNNFFQAIHNEAIHFSS
jgi:hypothetical protein